MQNIKIGKFQIYELRHSRSQARLRKEEGEE
jgi:hypothetical protein